MHIFRLLTATAMCCLLCALGEEISRTYGITAENMQLKNVGKLMTFNAVSVIECAAKCLMYGSQCGSFSFTKTKTCTISVLRLPVDGIGNTSEFLDAEDGTRVYGRKAGEATSTFIIQIIISVLCQFKFLL